MRKWNVLYICFVCVYLIIAFYFESHFKLLPIYWLIIKLICIAALFICLVFDLYTNKNNTKFYVVTSISGWLLLFGFYCYRENSIYQRNVCQDKFGREFNQRRLKLGIPEIPANWSIRHRGDGLVSWDGDTGKVGHQSTEIFLNANCTLDLEDDIYKLDPVKGVSRDMSITTHYAKGKGNDSVFYYFEVGDNNRLISRQQADSIFAAEKISKN